ncbi:MAG: DsbE family thiol:disulfide interchange protein [Pseudomonadota bacterium]
MVRFALPIIGFILVVALLAVGLTKDPRHVPSPLIGKALPLFELTQLRDRTTITAAHFEGRPRLLNVWASWCVACRTEHPLLVNAAQQKQVEIVGLNYKDNETNAKAWLAKHGDPYATSIFDPDGTLGLDLGVYGVPETFVVDAHGIIRYKHIGPLSADTLKAEVLPLLASLRAEP